MSDCGGGIGEFRCVRVAGHAGDCDLQDQPAVEAVPEAVRLMAEQECARGNDDGCYEADLGHTTEVCAPCFCRGVAYGLVQPGETRRDQEDGRERCRRCGNLYGTPHMRECDRECPAPPEQTTPEPESGNRSKREPHYHDIHPCYDPDCATKSEARTPIYPMDREQMWIDFGAAVRLARKGAGFTMGEVARRLGVPVAVVSALETGDADGTVLAVAALDAIRAWYEAEQYDLAHDMREADHLGRSNQLHALWVEKAQHAARLMGLDKEEPA